MQSRTRVVLGVEDVRKQLNNAEASHAVAARTRRDSSKVLDIDPSRRLRRDGSTKKGQPVAAAARKAVAALAAAASLVAWVAPPALANAELDVTNGKTDLTTSGSYDQATPPTTTSDITFKSGTAYSPAAFTISGNTALGIGTLNDLSSTSLTLQNGTVSTVATLTLNGGTNSVTGTVAGDLFYVGSTGNLTLQNGSGTLNLALNAAGNLDVVGTAAISSNISGAFGLTKTGAGTLTLSGTNGFTGSVTVGAGTLKAGSAGALGAAADPVSVTSGAVFDLNGQTIANTNALTLNGSGISGAGALINSSGTAATYSQGTITLASDTTIGGTGTINLGIASAANTAVLGGAFNLTKTGTGTLILNNGANTFGGAGKNLYIAQGTLQLGNNGTTGANFGNAATTIVLGDASGTNANNVILSYSAGGKNVSLANPISISAGTGTRTISTVSGAPTFSGAMTLANNVTITNSNGSAGGVIFSGGVTGTGNITLTATGAGSPITFSTTAVNNTGTITNTGTNNTAASVATISAAVGSNVGNITQSGINLFTVSGGITLGGDRTYSSTSTGLFTLGAITGSAAAGATQTVTFTPASSGSITDNGVIGNGAAGGKVAVLAAANGGGIVTLSGANTYTGGTTIQSGATLDFFNTAAMPGYPILASNPISVASGATLGLGFGSTGQFSSTDVTNILSGAIPVTLATGASVGLDTTTASATLSTPFSNAAGSTATGLSKLGGNTLTITGANTYSGPTTIQNGVLSVSTLNSVSGGASSSNLGAPNSVANGTISLGSGTATGQLTYTGPGETSDRAIILAGTTGGGILDSSGTGLLKFSGGVTETGAGVKTLTLQGASNGELSGTIAGGVLGSSAPLTITKTGSGNWLLSGAGNTATNLNINGGNIDTGPNGLTLNDGPGATVAASVTTTLNGKINLAGVGTAANGADFGSTVAGAVLTVNAVIAGGDTNSIDYYSSAAGTTILNAANTYSGQTYLNSQIVQVASINSVTGVNHLAASNLGAPTTAANGTILIGGGSTLRYVGTGETTDRVIALQGTTTGGVIDQSGTGLLKFTSAFTAPGAGIKTLTLQGSTPTGTGEIAGAIVDNSTTNKTSLTKLGTGTWTLSGASTYTGATTVSGGNLILNVPASLGSTLATTPVAITSGGTLSPAAGSSIGSTSAAGATLALSPGGVLNLADGTVGAFTIKSSVTTSLVSLTGGTINFDLGGATTAADQLIIGSTGTAAATLSGAATGINIVIPAGTSSLDTSHPYTLISAGGGGLSNSNLFLTSPTVVVGGQTYTLSLAGSTATAETLTISSGGAAGVPPTAFFTGQYGASWSYVDFNTTASNFVTAATGGNNTFAIPGATTNVTLTANSATNLATTLDQSFTINSLNFSGSGTSNTAGSSVSSGSGGNNTLTINAAAVNGNVAGNGITIATGSGANLVAVDVALGASQTWTNNSTNATSFSGNITGAGLTLTTAGTGAIQIGAGGTTGTIATNVAIVNNGVLAFNRSNTVTQGVDFNATVSGTGGITQNGTGALVLNGTNTYSGPTTISSGTLSAALQANLGTNATAAAITFPSGSTGTLRLTGTGFVGVAGAGVTLNGNGIIDLEGTDAATISGVISGTGSLSKIGSGLLTLSVASTFTGAVNVSGGLLAFPGTGTSADPTTLGAGVKNINLTNGGGVRVIAAYSNPSSGTKSFVIGSGGGTFDVPNGLFLQLDDAGQLAGTGDLTVQGTGTGYVLLNNQAFNFSGNVFVNSATLLLQANSVLGTTPGRTLTVASGAVLNINNGGLILPLGITLNGTGIGGAGAMVGTAATTLTSGITLASSDASIGGTATLTETGPVGGSGGLTKVGANTLVLAGASSYSGNTTISAGVLQIGSAGATGTLPTTGTFTDNGTFLINRTNAVSQGVDFPTAGITGTGGITQAGTGVTTLTVPNSYVGTTLVSAGTLTLSGPATLGATTAPLTVNGGGSAAAAGTLDLGGTSQTVGALNGVTGTALGAIQNNGGGVSTLTVNGGAYAGTIRDNTSGTGTVALVNLGSLTLSAASTFSGGTSSNGAAGINSYVQLTNAAGAGTGPIALSTGNGLLVGAAATIPNSISGAGDVENFNGTAQTVVLSGGLSYTGSTLFRFAASTVNFAPSVNSALSGPIGTPLTATTGYGAIATTASGNVIKSGSATLSLTGPSVYTGTTVVSGGTLALGATGSLANTAISVASGATFAALPGSGATSAGTTGAGTAGATLTLPSQAAFSMVDGAIGTFNLNQNASFAAAPLTLTSSILNLELASTGADQLVVAGGTGAAAITGTNVVNVSVLGSSLSNGAFTIINANGIAANNTLFKFGNGASTESLSVGGTTYTLSLGAIAGQEQITVTQPTISATLTWTGQTGGNGAPDSVWGTTGDTNFATGSTPASYTEGAAVTFQDLNTVTGTNVTNGTVTVQATGVSPASVTVNNSLAVPYTFNNAGGTIGIAGTTSLTKSGAGTLTLAGANTYSGGTAINGGIVNLGLAEGSGNGPLGTGPISFGGGTLQYSSFNQTDYSARFATGPNQAISIDTNGQNVTFAAGLTSLGGTFTKLGNGTLTLTSGPGANTYTGATLIGGGTLKLSSTAASAQAGILAGTPTITVTSGGTLLLQSTVGDLLGYTSGKEALIINGGTVTNNGGSTRITLQNVLTMTGGLLSGTSLGDTNSGAFSINGGIAATSDGSGNPATISANISTQTAISLNVSRGGTIGAGLPDLIISGPITPYGSGGTNGITKSGLGILQLSGANTYRGNTTLLTGTTLVGSTAGLSPNAGLVMGDTTGNAANLDLTTFSPSVTSLATNTLSPTAADAININPGRTLTVNGSVTIGPVATAVSQISKLTVAGGGALAVVSTGGTFTVGGNSTTNGNSEAATLDLTGLATATINLGATGTVRINNNQATNTAGNQSTLLLPTPSVAGGTAVATITTNVFDVGDAAGNTGTPGQINTVLLGSGVTALNANTVNIGTGGRDVGAITYSGSAVNGTLVVRAADGSSAAALNVGGGGTATSTGVAGGTANTFDVTGHNANLLLSTLTIGSQSRNSNVTSAFNFDTGQLTATAVQVGFQTAAAGTAAASTMSSALNIGGGTTNIGSGGLDLANNVNTGATAKSLNAAFNLTGGTVTIANNSGFTGGPSGGAIRLESNAGGANNATSASGTVSVTGGTLMLQGDVVVGSLVGATPSSATLTLDGGTLDLGGHNIGSVTASVPTLNLRSGTLANVGQVNNGGGFAKTTAGRLILSGINSFTGPTSVTGGTLNVTGQSNGTGTYNINTAGTLAGSGTVAAAVTIARGGTLSPSGGSIASPATLTLSGVGTPLTFSATGSAAAPSFAPVINGASNDTVKLTGGAGAAASTASVDPSTTLTLLDANPVVGTTYYLLDNATSGAAVSTPFAGAAQGSTITSISGAQYVISYTADFEGSSPTSTTGNDIAVTALTPEPGSIGLLGLGALGLLARRRRRAGAAK